MKPRNECGCHPVALSRSLAVAPPGRFSSSRIAAVLLPSRASFRALLGAFFFGVAFFPALALAGATFARRGARMAFFMALASVVVAAGVISVCSVVDFIVSPWAVITAITSIAPVGQKCKAIVLIGGDG